MWSRSRGALCVLLHLHYGSFASGFVPNAVHHGLLSSAARHQTSASARSGIPLAGDSHPLGSKNCERRGRVGQLCEAATNKRVQDGMVDEEEGQQEAQRVARPAFATTAIATTASGLAAGAGVLALVTLAGFPEMAAAEAPGWVGPTKLVLDPILLYFEFAFVSRIVLSWYPALDLNRVPQNFVAWPTEPILRPTRAVVPPAFGVDVSPIVWVMICSFLHEILLGQQGILNLISNK